MTKSPDNHFKERILDKIQEEHLEMRPKAYFTAQLVVLGVLALMASVLSILIVNFISFGIRLNGHESFLGFGAQGILAFLLAFPWPLFLLDAVVLIALGMLLRTFEFGYRSPVLYLIGILLLGSVVLGLGLDRGTPLNDRFYGERSQLPTPFGNVYEQVRQPLSPGKGTCRCTVRYVEGSIIHADDIDNGTSTPVLITVPSEYRAILTTLHPGDKIFVLGAASSTPGNITARGIRPVMPGEGPGPERH